MYEQSYLWYLDQRRHEGMLREAQERHLAEQMREVRGSRSGRGRVGLTWRGVLSLLRGVQLSE